MIKVSLTPSQFAAKAAALKRNYGVSLNAPGPDGAVRGVATKDGIRIGYEYDPVKAAFSARILSAPSGVTAVAENELRKWLKA